MKKMIQKNRITTLMGLAVFFVAALTSCKKNNDTTSPSTPTTTVPAQSTTYSLKVKDVIGVTGTVTFAEKSSGSSESVVTIHLSGAPTGTHPAHIYFNSAIETGGIAYVLTSVDTSGNSTTTLSVPYSTLLEFDGYVNVHGDLSLISIIAQGDIGGNLLTGDKKSYTLVQDSTSGISGTALFEKRRNGNTLVSIDLTSGGLLPTGSYPAHINLGSVSTIGTPYNKKTLNPVDDATRKSITNIRKLDDGTVITYANWLVYDGFITIDDANDTTNVIAKGNIGGN